ncbi:CRISPR-associated endonuclease Cas2 [Micropruina sp.]|uniref:CRISPR-associated endonuclease Cas2 n=1 Tax=Micropruina sp. TaxID=2737536 RepID=UPI0039E30183
MARRRYLIAYDISDPVRLRRVIKVMESYGERLQYSVFLCDLSDAELVDWLTDISAVVKLTADSVVRIDLGDTRSPAGIHVIGTGRRLPHAGTTIV